MTAKCICKDLAEKCKNHSSKCFSQLWLFENFNETEYNLLKSIGNQKIIHKGQNIFFEGAHQLEKTKWGMVEPKQGTKAEAKDIDMVIVPLLAIDKQGHRIGYGKPIVSI